MEDSVEVGTRWQFASPRLGIDLKGKGIKFPGVNAHIRMYLIGGGGPQNVASTGTCSG